MMARLRQQEKELEAQRAALDHDRAELNTFLQGLTPLLGTSIDQQSDLKLHADELDSLYEQLQREEQRQCSLDDGRLPPDAGGLGAAQQQMVQAGVGQMETDDPPPRPLTLLEAMQVKKLEGELNYANKKIQALLEDQSRILSDDSAYSQMARVISPPAVEAGDHLRSQMASRAGAQRAVAAAERAGDSVEISQARINQMAREVERLLYGGGGGSVERTRVLWAAVVERPAVQRLFNLTDPSEAKMADAARMAMAHAKKVLANVHSKGTRSSANHLAFETIVAALMPDDAKEAGVMRTLAGSHQSPQKGIESLSRHTAALQPHGPRPAAFGRHPPPLQPHGPRRAASRHTPVTLLSTPDYPGIN